MISVNRKHILLKNNAISALGADLPSSSTTLQVRRGEGNKFPIISNKNEYFYVTISSAANPEIYEIVKVINTNGDVFTVERSQDGTSASGFVAGDKVEMRITKAMLEDVSYIDVQHTPDGFTDLTDTPSSYSGNAGRLLSVNETENGIAFTDSPDLSIYEEKTNKVTSFSQTPSDEHYPSEKLVKDSLDDKADKNHIHKIDDIKDFQEAVSNNKDVSANTEARHTHENKSLLDKLTDEGDGTKFLADDGTYKNVPSGSGASSFLDLTDTPDSYSGHEFASLRVNANGTGIIFKKYQVVSETPLVADYVGVGAPGTDINPNNVGDIYFDRDKGQFWKCLDNTPNKNIWSNLQTKEMVQASTISKLDIFEDGSSVALWQLDGDANDTGGVYNGDWEGSELYDVGKFGQAAKFDNNGSLIDMKDPVLQDKKLYSVFFWLYLVKYSYDNSGSFSKYNGYSKYRFIFGERRGYLAIFDGVFYDWKTGSKLELNKWNHIGFVMYEDKTEIYLNGRLDFSVNKKIRFDNSYNLTIGSTQFRRYSTKQLIDQIRIFNRPLTLDEIQILYNEK